jgi:predicted DNA-binding transcriptional regulator YafY
MKIEENQKVLERIVQLARKKSTGKPHELAEKLGVSERTVYRLKDALLDQGLRIRYSRIVDSYILE